MSERKIYTIENNFIEKAEIRLKEHQEYFCNLLHDKVDGSDLLTVSAYINKQIFEELFQADKQVFLFLVSDINEDGKFGISRNSSSIIWDTSKATAINISSLSISIGE